ncbi:MAG: transporter suffix domain-containing protein [Acidiferrobacterales bacterium]
MNNRSTEATNNTILWPEKDWKFYLGLVLFVISWGTFGIMLVIPFLPLSAGKAAAIVTALLICTELTFWASAALLGKQFLRYLKEKLWSIAHTADASGSSD